MCLRYVNHKDYPGKVFQLQEVDDTKATFVHPGLWQQPTTAEVPFEQLPQWKATKQEMARLCPADHAKACLYQSDSKAKAELAKLQVEMAMHKAASLHEVSHDQVAFAMNPQGVHSLVQVKKLKALKLVCIGNVAKAKPTTSQEEQKAQHKVSHQGDWIITSWRQDTAFDATQPLNLNPYWWVKPCEEEGGSNMVFSTVTVDGIQIPILQNSKPLEAPQQLLYHSLKTKTKTKKASLHDSEPKEEPQPKKRIKAKVSD